MIGRYTSYMQRLPRPLGIALKSLMVYPRYWYQKRAARLGFKEFGSRYPHPLLFIAGLPKSGTTWLERMVAQCPGYREVLIPEASYAELRGESGHLFTLPEDPFSRFEGCLVLAKMHCPGSVENAATLKRYGIPYVILFRDPRDIAISYVHYVQGTPWHLDHAALRSLDVREGIRFFIRTRLPEFAQWMRGWRQNRDPERSLMLSYEELLEDSRGALLRVFRLFGLELSDEEIDEILVRNRFDRSQAGPSGGSFFRKGMKGEWAEHFDDELKREFIESAGDLLVDFGYENDHEW